ncbi:hypothetical protein [uncultured Chryseobacterium sp.]|uniref:hypothetical protein n=1 Tax=uncultured Chryseobacterium sp. TaxID=259322 RepID=UPI002600774E|nr:hypothetical protein [uncultured Chryseobacterium sp.]
MKNTEYKDVFDFGEEALSMEDKFSAPSFPSFKNAFTLGENIRGMTNVSPLATVKFFNQTSDDLLTKYYPDSENVQKGNTNVITDADISNSELNRFEEDYYFDNNHNGKFGDSGDILAFKLVLFISTDGLKIRESYEVTEPKNDEIILFLETDGGLSKQVLFGKMSEKVRKQFTDKNGNLKSNLYDSEILKGVRKYYKDANQEVIEKLIKNGYIEESIIKEGFFKVLKYLGIATNALPKITGWILGKLGSWIDYLKIDEQFWDTENENYFLKKENIIENFTISTETIKKIEELLNNQDDLSVADLMPEAIEEGIQYIVSKTKTTIEQYNEFVKEKIEELYSAFDNPTADFIFKDLAEGFAFLCGIWNGAVDFISGTFKFAALLLQAPFNIVSEFQTTLELVDNFWDTITTKIFWVNLWESTKETYTKIKNELTNLDSANFNWVKIAYFTGFGLATIVSFFIPVAQIANVAKAGKIGEIIAKFTSEISSVFVKGANIIGQKSAQAFENSIKIIREMLALFSKGKKKLTAFFENVWKKIVEWFKKNKNLLEATWIKAQKIFSQDSKYDALYRDITKKFFIQNGGVMSESQFLKLASKIKEAFKIDMLTIDKNSEKYAVLFKKWQQNPIYAVFHESTFVNGRYGVVLEGPAIYFFKGIAKGSFGMDLIVEITAYTVQHELLHLKLWHKMVIEFPELASLYRKIPRVLDELNVVGEMLKQNAKKIGKWDINDIQNDIDIINDNPKWKSFIQEHFGKDNIELADLKNWDLSKHLKKL